MGDPCDLRWYSVHDEGARVGCLSPGDIAAHVAYRAYAVEDVDTVRLCLEDEAFQPPRLDVLQSLLGSPQRLDLFP